jgi:hypothetical protein
VTCQDVPERDVDRRDGGGGDLATLEIRATVHVLPEVLDAVRILAEQESAEMLEHALHGELPTGDTSFADPR